MPLLFDSVVGKDEREGNSPSWFNVQECKQVSQVCVILLLCKAATLT
jgi:helicase MOV-10